MSCGAPAAASTQPTSLWTTHLHALCSVCKTRGSMCTSCMPKVLRSCDWRMHKLQATVCCTVQCACNCYVAGVRGVRWVELRGSWEVPCSHVQRHTFYQLITLNLMPWVYVMHHPSQHTSQPTCLTSRGAVAPARCPARTHSKVSSNSPLYQSTDGA